MEPFMFLWIDRMINTEVACWTEQREIENCSKGQQKYVLRRKQPQCHMGK